MTARKASFSLSGISLILALGVMGLIIFGPFAGAALVGAVAAFAILIGLSILAFVAAFNANPKQALGDNILEALISLLFSW